MPHRPLLLSLLGCTLLAACTAHRPAPPALPEPSRLDAARFDTVVDGKAIGLYTLRSAAGMEMSVTNYGARIVTLMPDGQTDVVCGFDSIGPYLHRRQNFGAVVGRYIGRILGARMTLDGTDYALDRDGNGHCSHGGRPGFAGRVWDVVAYAADSLVLRYTSPDGESGFPGTLALTVAYRLDSTALRIDYRATTDRPTVLNPSNHTFFNLSGRLGEAVLDEVLQIAADSIAEYDARKCVTGRMLPVAGTAFDFRTPRAIGDRIDADDAQLAVTGGYDHCYLLPVHAEPDAWLRRPAARLASDVLTMEVYTTEPAVQIYTANGHRGDIVGKDGVPYVRRNSICFETMHLPDSPNRPHWPTTVLRPGETFRSTTVFRFAAAAGR